MEDRAKVFARVDDLISAFEVDHVIPAIIEIGILKTIGMAAVEAWIVGAKPPILNSQRLASTAEFYSGIRRKALNGEPVDLVALVQFQTHGLVHPRMAVERVDDLHILRCPPAGVGLEFVGHLDRLLIGCTRLDWPSRRLVIRDREATVIKEENLELVVVQC